MTVQRAQSFGARCWSNAFVPHRRNILCLVLFFCRLRARRRSHQTINLHERAYVCVYIQTRCCSNFGVPLCYSAYTGNISSAWHVTCSTMWRWIISRARTVADVIIKWTNDIAMFRGPPVVLFFNSDRRRYVRGKFQIQLYIHVQDLRCALHFPLENLGVLDVCYDSKQRDGQ